jgi:hypothetical protein
MAVMLSSHVGMCRGHVVLILVRPNHTSMNMSSRSEDFHAWAEAELSKAADNEEEAARLICEAETVERNLCYNDAPKTWSSRRRATSSLSLSIGGSEPMAMQCVYIHRPSVRVPYRGGR